VGLFYCTHRAIDVPYIPSKKDTMTRFFSSLITRFTEMFAAQDGPNTNRLAAARMLTFGD
jgi:hypothetical protein